VYYSQQITIPDQDSFPERLILVLPASGTGRGGLVAGENDTWTLTVATQANEHPTPPKTLTEMLTLAEEFVPAHVRPVLRQAQPLTDVAVYRYPGCTWHRYDRCERLPEGLLVIGDALCRLNPIFGQGITMAARQAHLLRTHLREQPSPDPPLLHQSLATLIAPVWATNRPPGQSRSRRSLKDTARQRAVEWTRRKVLEAAATDIVVTERLVRVGHMIDPPQRLLEPCLLGRVAAHHLRRAINLHPTVRPD
jgi:2-polyprenyl-6-methoxyphenol hydroxylase-like FAD-dependent oxidoreductase